MQRLPATMGKTPPHSQEQAIAAAPVPPLKCRPPKALLPLCAPNAPPPSPLSTPAALGVSDTNASLLPSPAAWEGSSGSAASASLEESWLRRFAWCLRLSVHCGREDTQRAQRGSVMVRRSAGGEWRRHQSLHRHHSSEILLPQMRSPADMPSRWHSGC
jgi:hypothetical protein